MPELPDIELYVAALRARVTGATVLGVRVHGPSWLRTVEPPLAEAEGRSVRGIRRVGKRIVLELDGDLFLVLHLMIAGRLQWRAAGARSSAERAVRRPRTELGAIEFSTGTLVATEAGTRKRAALHLLRGEAALAEHDPGGLEPLAASRDEFAARLRAANHTLKRSLTDPRVLSGVGNAYSDEILHAARLSPFKQTQKLADDEMDRLYAATQATLREWSERLRAETGDEFPTRVTASGKPAKELKDAKRAGMRVHARTGETCPECGDIIREVSFADTSLQYCATCQTGGKPLADRRMSRLLK